LLKLQEQKQLGAFYAHFTYLIMYLTFTKAS
jgi:hypothetical protein